MITKQFAQDKVLYYMNHMKNEFGSDVEILTKVVDLTNPAKPKIKKKAFKFKCILEEDEDAYEKNAVDNKEYKICSILIKDIEEVNATQGANIPVPPKSLKKEEGLEIKIDDGTPFQIREENVDGYGLFYRLRIEREY